MKTITKIAAAVAVTASMGAFADTAIVSQFDGKNTFINTYTFVDDAKQFALDNDGFFYVHQNGGGPDVLEGTITGVDSVLALGSSLGFTSNTTITSSNGTQNGDVISGSVTTSDNVTYTGSINTSTGVYSISFGGDDGSMSEHVAIHVLPAMK